MCEALGLIPPKQDVSLNMWFRLDRSQISGYKSSAYTLGDVPTVLKSPAVHFSEHMPNIKLSMTVF